MNCPPTTTACVAENADLACVAENAELASGAGESI
jgi:hypothetical protein